LSISLRKHFDASGLRSGSLAASGSLAVSGLGRSHPEILTMTTWFSPPQIADIGERDWHV
jgi:hypothetical protein